MIGVLVHSRERRTVAEFFELFKTHWEFAQPGRAYPVMLITTGDSPPQTGVVLRFGSHPYECDKAHDTVVKSVGSGAEMQWEDVRCPLYCEIAQVVGPGRTLASVSDGSSIILAVNGRYPTIRFGYDLVAEVEFLLNRGQPAQNAIVPTLDRHIELVRQVIVHAGHGLVELPPIPVNYSCIACLTHDVDHPSLRAHRLDITAAGFLGRALAKTPWDFLRGRAGVRKLIANVAAAFRFPLMHLGAVRDDWTEFSRYMELEPGNRSTFYVIPHARDAGLAINRNGNAPARRASAYEPGFLVDSLKKITAAGGEIALHGLNAWASSEDARREANELAPYRSSPCPSEIGVRMHWLYFDEGAWEQLEEAGFSYDSTWGYNDTVGYRAGTAQVFQPHTVSRLLELPMHVMDTSLFYPSYLNLAPADALPLLARLVRHAYEQGGSVTINWHDRSLFAERHWGDVYIDLLQQLKSAGAWFATAAETVSWFRSRRNMSFTGDGRGAVRVNPAEQSQPLPAVRMRTHAPGNALVNGDPLRSRTRHTDVPIGQSLDSDLTGTALGGGSIIPLPTFK